MDTIFAQASAPGRAGVSIIRISGPDAFPAAESICKIPKAGQFRLSPVLDTKGGLIDRALVLAFKNGASFTGEDVIELHLHGSIAIVSKVLNLLGNIENCRLAKPGEFTRRALENGNLDLCQVEALSDLIDAETESQRLQAMRVFDGELGQIVEDWRGKMIRSLALLEASIDFADEEIPDDLGRDVLNLLMNVRGSMQLVLDGSARAEKIRDGFVVAIVGAPNVGKSTLLNSIAGRSAAITSDIAGTTRDVIEVRIDLKGLAVTFLDTAGIRDSDDQIETLGIDLAKERAAQADLRVFLVEDVHKDLPLTPSGQDIVLLNKADLRDQARGAISGKSNVGVSQLLDQIAETFQATAPVDVSTIRARQSSGIRDSINGLGRAIPYLDSQTVVYELASFEVRGALASLDFVFGRVDIETILTEIFSSFCLGK